MPNYRDFDKLFSDKRSGNNINIATNLSCEINDYGDFKVYYDVSAIISKLKYLFMTVKGTYLFDPEYGVGIHKYLFEPADDTTLNNIMMDISYALKKYGPKYANIVPKIYFFSDKKGFRIDMDITYLGTKKNLKIDIDENFEMF